MQKKPVEWADSARAALAATMEKIHREDARVAQLVALRLEASLAVLQLFPKLGTPISGTRSRSYAVPHTGHSFNHRVTANGIHITRWYRQRQNVRRQGNKSTRPAPTKGFRANLLPECGLFPYTVVAPATALE